jgi:hypothetical protein
MKQLQNFGAIIFLTAVMLFGCNEHSQHENPGHINTQVDSTHINCDYFAGFDIQTLRPIHVLFSNQKPFSSPFVRVCQDKFDTKTVDFCFPYALRYRSENGYLVRRDSDRVKGSDIYTVSYIVPGSIISYGYDRNPDIFPPKSFSKVVTTLDSEVRYVADSFPVDSAYPSPEIKTPKMNWFEIERRIFRLNGNLLHITTIDSIKRDGDLAPNYISETCYELGEFDLFWRVFWRSSGRELSTCDKDQAN